mgnify:CR=1 FL=1
MIENDVALQRRGGSGKLTRSDATFGGERLREAVYSTDSAPTRGAS